MRTQQHSANQARTEMSPYFESAEATINLGFYYARAKWKSSMQPKNAHEGHEGSKKEAGIRSLKYRESTAKPFLLELRIIYFVFVTYVKAVLNDLCRADNINMWGSRALLINFPGHESSRRRLVAIFELLFF